MTVTAVGSFLIKKRYITAKEEGLKQFFVIEYQKGDCFVPRKDANRGWLFLNRRLNVIAKEEGLNILLLSNIH
jgi:hypothetical protein